MAGVTSATADALPIAGGLGEMFAAAGPSPIPRGPWQDAQLAANNRSPAAASSGRAGSSRAASLPSDDANRLASAPSSEGGRLAVTARMIEQRRRRRQSVAGQARHRGARVAQESDGLVVFVARRQAAFLVHSLPVFFDGHTHDVRDALGRALLLRPKRARSDRDGHRKGRTGQQHRRGPAKLGSEPHCRVNISGFRLLV
jgi:hypothetical protein